MSQNAPEPGREQRLVKHLILRRYLQRLARVIGRRWRSITYVDCFSGPWQEPPERPEDTPFGIALQELRGARSTLAEVGRPVGLRCFFPEKDPVAYRALKGWAGGIDDAEIETRNAGPEGSVGSILAFVRRGGRRSFPLIFLDPAGWTGFALDTIAPLLKLNPCDVLINFRAGSICRHLGWPGRENQGSFRVLLGSSRYQTRLLAGAPDERADVLARCYAEAVRATGEFHSSCPAVVLHPGAGRAHGHVIYATRHARGLEVFKEAEKSALKALGLVREQARGRHARGEAGHRILFPGFDDPVYLRELRERHLSRCILELREWLAAGRRVCYDDILGLAAQYPLVYESDLKEWVALRQDEGQLQAEGPGKGKRPKKGAGHHLTWGASVPPRQRFLFE